MLCCKWEEKRRQAWRGRLFPGCCWSSRTGVVVVTVVVVVHFLRMDRRSTCQGTAAYPTWWLLSWKQTENVRDYNVITTVRTLEHCKHRYFNSSLLAKQFTKYSSSMSENVCVYVCMCVFSCTYFVPPSRCWWRRWWQHR